MYTIWPFKNYSNKHPSHMCQCFILLFLTWHSPMLPFVSVMLLRHVLLRYIQPTQSIVTVENTPVVCSHLWCNTSLCGMFYSQIHIKFINKDCWISLISQSSSTSYLEYQAGGGKGLVDLVNQLTLERCHSFWFYGSCRKRIPIRDSSMPKRILSQCGVSSKMFIGLIVPTTCSSVRWD